jgi:ribosomal protein S18 acetylase RimI-like enzyme
MPSEPLSSSDADINHAPRAEAPKALGEGATGASAKGHAPSILRVPEDRRMEAVQALLRADRGGAERFIAFAADHRIRLDAMWGRLDDRGRIGWTVLASPGHGRTATLFATPARSAGDLAPLAGLVAATLQGVASLGVDLAQSLVEPAETRQRALFEAGGMERLAELSYLERPTPRGRTSTPTEWPSDIAVERWDAGPDPTGGSAGSGQRGTAASRAELIETLERSYVGTLDCPALAGLRRGEDVLDGHLNSGIFEPTLWTILRFRSGPHAGRTAGVCLFNSSPPQSAAGANAGGSLELVYFGLVPEARGRGLGRLLLRHGLDGLRGRGESAVMLAVDDRNAPAHALYREAGFRVRFKRIALIRSVRAAPVDART